MAASDAPDVARVESEVTLEDAIEIATRAHRAGDFDVAETLYGRILAIAPGNATILHYFGILHHQTKRPLDAIRLIRSAIEIESADPGMHNNLGNIFLELDRPDLALHAYQATIVLDPGNVDARNNLGVTLRTLDLLHEAELAYREAVDLDPGHRETWDNFGRLLASRGRIQEAITCHARALELEPSNAGTRRFLVAAYAATNASDRALALLREWILEDPNNASAQHLIAAISGKNVPDRASDRYVEALFDSFAASFDHKLDRLEYRAPKLVADAVAQVHAPVARIDILDAGCGTGLCGPDLRPYARDLVGVDLSAKMLEKAADRGCYDRLERAELIDFLARNPATYDLVISADTLCYFGRLDPVFAAAQSALRPGGHTIFSVEEGQAGETYKLYGHGRYSHADSYVRDTLAATGFDAGIVLRSTLRMERGEPVAGLVVTARRR